MSNSEHAALSVPDHQGENYLAVLGRLHTELRPNSYLEIGTRWGDSLRLAKCPAIAIDPNVSFGSDVLAEKPICAFFRMTSDSFFANHDLQVRGHIFVQFDWDRVFANRL